MAGNLSGVKARIQAEFPKAVYVHCVSHKLNLVIVEACKIPAVRNAMGVITKVADFFKNSLKRQAFLEKKICEQGQDQAPKRTKLLGLCKTRWIQRHDALENFDQLFTTLIVVFEDIKDSSTGWNRETVTDATTLLHCISQFEFVMAFTTMIKVMSTLNGLSVKLQSFSRDISKVYKDVDRTCQGLQHFRDNVSEHSDRWFKYAPEKVREAVGESDYEPCLPRRCGRQRNRANVSAETAEEYFRRTTAIRFLDHFLGQMK